MTLEIKNITSGHRYCSIQSNIVPQIGSSVTLDDRPNRIFKVQDVVYNLFPSSDEILCEVLVKQHIGKVIELERDDSLRPLLK